MSPFVKGTSEAEGEPPIEPFYGTPQVERNSRLPFQTLSS